jgi:hypothetical protein
MLFLLAGEIMTDFIKVQMRRTGKGNGKSGQLDGNSM